MVSRTSTEPFNNNGNNSYIKDVLYVPTITKNLDSVGEIVKQGMTVQFSTDGCFIKDKGRLAACGRREGRMFTLNASEVSTTLYAKGLKQGSDIELWHKRTGHVNLGSLRSMQTKGNVRELLQFSSKKPGTLCEAC